MSIAQIALVSFASITASVAAITAFLPSTAVVERSQVLDASPEEVFALINSNAGYQQFNPYKTQDPELNIDLFGPQAGVGSGFTFDGKDGKGTSTIIESRANEYVAMEVDLGPIGKPVQSIELRAQDGKTLVTWKMEMDLGANPLKRGFGLFMDGMMGKTYELGLDNLGKATA